MRGYVNEGVAAKVRAAGGEIFAVSSEPQALAGRAACEWALDFETVGDPHHEITGTCRERGWLDLFVNERMEFLLKSTALARAWVPTHPKGYFQPGVLALAKDGRVLYRWRGVPTRRNMGGASERPTAEHVWERIADAIECGPTAGDASLDADPPIDMKGAPWPVFVSLLIANGWFLDGRGFESSRRIALAGLRLVGFVAAWIAAFVLLPAVPVAAVFALWVAYITPKVRWLGREFQDATKATR